MKNRLILVEGIPGSGKTTTSKKLKDYLKEQGYPVKQWNEGDLHPVDMAWLAYLTLSEYETLLNENSMYKDLIEQHTVIEDDHAIIAYTQLGLSPKEHAFIRYLENHEIYNGRVSLETFKHIHINRWSKFAQNLDDDTIVVLECVYFQNHINELLAYYNQDVDFIKGYLVDLIETVQDLNPLLIYLTQSDVKEIIERVSKERISSDKTKWSDWIDLVIDYVENSHYGHKHQLKGFDGVVTYFKARKQVELEVFNDIEIDKIILPNNNYDWDAMFNKLVESLK